MFVQYTGPETARDIRLPGGQEIRAVKGEAVEVPDTDGEGLCRQQYFEEVTTRQTSRRAAEPQPEPEPEPESADETEPVETEQEI